MAISKRVRVLVYNKYSGHCAYCGKEIAMKGMQVDHVQSRYNNGKDDISNLMPSCRACNFREGTCSIDQFRNELREQARTLTKTFQGRMSLQYGFIEYHDHPIVFYFERMCKNCTSYSEYKRCNFHGFDEFEPNKICDEYKVTTK